MKFLPNKMIVKSYIRHNLLDIERRFQRARNQKEPLYYSKLAILELCGWIEISVDDLISRAVRYRVKESASLRLFDKSVVNPIYGFHYSKHFRKMLCSAIGEIHVSTIEKNMDQLKREQLESELNTLTKNRNSLAHTYLKGMTQQIDAPSRTIARFNLIYDGLKEFETEIFSRI